MSRSIIHLLYLMYIQLIEIRDILEKQNKESRDFNIIAIFMGFSPIFIFLLSFMQQNSLEYWIIFLFFAFFFGICFIWSIIQVAKAETQFTYGLALFLPLFIIALPLVLSVLIAAQVIRGYEAYFQLSLVIIIIYAIVFFVIFEINFLYERIILREKKALVR